MKRILLLSCIFFPFFIFSQSVNKEININWISLEKAEEYAQKYNKEVLILFYRPGCDYCQKMKKETLSDPEIVTLINENFLPVMLNGKSKNPISYNGKVYTNEHPYEKDAPWRHDLFVELVEPVNGNFYWPDVVILKSNLEKKVQFAGFQSKQQLLRNIKRLRLN